MTLKLIRYDISSYDENKQEQSIYNANLRSKSQINDSTAIFNAFQRNRDGNSESSSRSHSDWCLTLKAIFVTCTKSCLVDDLGNCHLVRDKR